MNKFKSCENKQLELVELFSKFHTQEEIYDKIISLGQKLPPYPEQHKIDKNLVKGCQSLLYLYTSLENDCIRFQVTSDAIISSGLAHLLIKVYDNETPETVLKCPPTFIEKTGILASLTPGRSNGFASLYLRMKQEALKFLVERTRSST